MQSISKFRGTCGEVVCRYVSPMTYVSALPIAIGLLLLNWLCSHFGTYRTYVTLPVMTVFITLATMRFAVPASRGDLEPSNEPGEILSYSGRYLLLNITWYLPWLIIWKLITKSTVANAVLIFMNPLANITSAWNLLLRAALIFVALLLPTFCLLISLYSSTTKGLYSKHSWEWLLKQRRADLIPFWSCLIGGSTVMLACVFVPAVALTYLGFKDSAKTGIYLTTFLYVWYISTIPVLNGWLSGVFVAHDYVQLEFAAVEPLVAVSPEEIAPLQAAIPRPPEARPDLADIERRVAETDDALIETALEAARELEISQTAPIRGQIEQMLLAMRTGDLDSVRSAAAKAIDGAAQRGFTDISMKLFEKTGAERRSLKLAAYSLEILGTLYQQKKQLIDAAWCFHAAAVNSGDTIKAQKRLFQVAELAEKSGKYNDALTLYEVLIKQYPKSTLVEFAQQGAERSKSQIGS